MGVLEQAALRQAQGQTFALATVVRTVSVTAAKAGAKALIGPDGSIEEGGITPIPVTTVVALNRAGRTPASCGANSNARRGCRSLSTEFFAARPDPSEGCTPLIPWQNRPPQLLGDVVRTMPYGDAHVRGMAEAVWLPEFSGDRHIDG